MVHKKGGGKLFAVTFANLGSFRHQPHKGRLHMTTGMHAGLQTRLRNTVYVFGHAHLHVYDAERPRDASCLSVVSFNIPTAQFFLLLVTALQIY